MVIRNTTAPAAFLVALMLTACATPDSAQHSDPADAVPSDTPAPATDLPETDLDIVFPEPLFSPSCDDIVPLDRVHELYGSEFMEVDIDAAGFTPGLLVPSAARADGALACHWAKPTSTFPTMSITATVASADEFAISAAAFDALPRPSAPLPLLAGARAECTDTFPWEPLVSECHWSIYFDGVWIVAHFDDLPAGEVIPPAQRVNPDTSSNSPVARADGLTALILADAATTLARSGPPSATRIAPRVDCDQLLADPSVAAELGAIEQVVNDSPMVPEDLLQTIPWMGGMIGSLGVERQGWSRCIVGMQSAESSAIHITYAPGARWILESDGFLGQEEALLPAGDGKSACFPDEGASPCTVAVASAADLIIVTKYGTSDVQAIERLSRTISDVIDEIFPR